MTTCSMCPECIEKEKNLDRTPYYQFVKETKEIEEYNRKLAENNSKYHHLKINYVHSPPKINHVHLPPKINYEYSSHPPLTINNNNMYLQNTHTYNEKVILLGATKQVSKNPSKKYMISQTNHQHQKVSNYLNNKRRGK